MTDHVDIWPEFINWQKTAAKEAMFYKMDRAEQAQAVREEWADDLHEAWRKELARLEDEMLNKPVTSWRDVAILGMLVLRYHGGSFDGYVEDLDADAAQMSRVTGYLVRAVGIMAQREGISPLIADADFDKGLLRQSEAA